MKNDNKPKSVNIPVEKSHPFEGHPYKVLDDDEMNMLVESIQQHGILSPIIVRPLENKTDEYEVISGHRRLHAAEKAGIHEVPALIYALDRNAAAIAVVDSNLHREHILPSEKAFAYKMKMESMKHQGVSSQVATKTDTAAEIGKRWGESRDQVFRYIRLTHLIPELLQYVDDGKIALTPAVELSYLTKEEQTALYETIESEQCTPSLSQAQRMKKMSQADGLTPEIIAAVMSEAKANQRETLKLPLERVRQFAPKADQKQLEDFVLKACEHYRKYLNRLQERDR